MTFGELITRVQNIGRDYTGRIWNDTAVKAYINQGYTEFVLISHCLKKTGKITLTPNIATYSLPLDCLQVNRAEFNQTLVPFITEMEMDNMFGAGWRTATGSAIIRIMQDNQGEGTIRVYPLISESDDLGTLVTVVGTDSNDYYCIKDHTATTDDKPITGANYPLYWKATGGTGAGAVWVEDTDYTEYYYLYLDYAYLPTALTVTTASPVIASQYHYALAEYAIYLMQSQEVQSKKKPISAYNHMQEFNRVAQSAKSRTMRGYALNIKKRQIRFPFFA